MDEITTRRERRNRSQSLPTPPETPREYHPQVMRITPETKLTSNVATVATVVSGLVGGAIWATVLWADFQTVKGDVATLKADVSAIRQAIAPITSRPVIKPGVP